MAHRKLLLGAVLSHVVFTAVEILCGSAWAHEYTKLHTVSLRDENILTCIEYFFCGQTTSPWESNPVTVAVKCYEDNCHYVVLIRMKCELALRAYHAMNTIICSSALQWTLQNVVC